MKDNSIRLEKIYNYYLAKYAPTIKDIITKRYTKTYNDYLFKWEGDPLTAKQTEYVNNVKNNCRPEQVIDQLLQKFYLFEPLSSRGLDKMPSNRSLQYLKGARLEMLCYADQYWRNPSRFPVDKEAMEIFIERSHAKRKAIMDSLKPSINNGCLYNSQNNEANSETKKELFVEKHKPIKQENITQRMEITSSNYLAILDEFIDIIDKESKKKRIFDDFYPYDIICTHNKEEVKINDGRLTELTIIEERIDFATFLSKYYHLFSQENLLSMLNLFYDKYWQTNIGVQFCYAACQVLVNTNPSSASIISQSKLSGFENDLECFI